MKFTGSKKNITAIREYIRENWTYRLAEGSWAGGDNTFNVNKGDIFFDGYSNRVWSSNRKWSGLDAEFIFHIPVAYEVEYIGGLLTFTNPRTNKSYWAKQGRGFSLKLEIGYVYKGYHQKETKKINNYQLAVKHISQKRAAAAAKLWEKRVKKAIPLDRVWVGIQDSLDGGNCKDGTKNFISRMGLTSIGGVRADYLLELDNTTFTRRAIEAARIRA